MTLDIEQADQLVDWLRRQGRVDAKEAVECRRLTGGVSNRTMLVRRASGESWVLKQALPKLRVASDWYSSPERIHREALGLRWLAQHGPPGGVPGFVFEDFEEHILAMTAVPEPHSNWKTLLLEGKLDLERVREFGGLLAAIHRESARVASTAAIEFADTRYFEDLRLEPYYLHAALRLSEAGHFLRTLVEDTRHHRSALVHGDFSPKNTLVQGDRLILLDHEVIHWGDPAFDVGFGLTHLLAKAVYVRPARARFFQAACLFWQTYAQQSGMPLDTRYEARCVRHTVGCLLARIAGRSPLEYLTSWQRSALQAALLSMLSHLPETIEELVMLYGSKFGQDTA